MITVRIFSRTTVQRAPNSRLGTVGWFKAKTAVTVTQTIAYSVSAAVVWTGFATREHSQIVHRHTFLVNTHL